jgi:molybdopterin converting factor small subunit
MVLEVYMFGIAKEIFGNRSIQIVLENSNPISIEELKSLLEKKQPSLREVGSYMIAVNNDYAVAGYLIHEKDAIAVIPPVSGG